ncbi:MAG: NAD(P)/FAD-dependent oxidoreductase [Vicinamibacterales bacterium]
MRAFDVVIAGAGPAGSLAARDLARSGARVALIDGSHPREKACGGGVTSRALRLIGGDALIAAAQPIDAIAFEAAGRRVQVCLPDTDVLGVYSRAAFDADLLRQATDAGVVHVPARVGAIARHGAAWDVSAGNTTLSAPWLLGADGPAGVVRKQVFRPFARGQLSIAAGSFVDGVSVRDIVIAFTSEPSGYLWSFPRPGHLAVGSCAQATETTTAEMHRVTDHWLDRYAPAAKLPRRRYAWPIPSLEARDVDAEIPAGDGWMLLGDAAGLVDPITREGIFFALRSGILAAEALQRASPARHYADSVRDELHGELRRAARLKAGFFRPRFTSLMIEALARSTAIQDVMVDLVAGRQPYAGLRRRLLGTLEFGLMRRVLFG